MLPDILLCGIFRQALMVFDVTKPASATLSLFAGIANEDIADSAYGLLQAYGYRSAGYVINGVTAIAAGNILIPENAAWSLTYRCSQ